jgi:L-ribulose-5-phosphate 3-epimerase
MMPLNRRQFVGLTAAGLAAAATPRSFASTLPAPTPLDDGPWIKRSLKIGMIDVDGDLTAKFAAARAAGFDGVELDSPGPYSLEDVRRAKQETGLAVPGVVLSTHWGKPFNHPDASVRAEADAALATALRDCRDFGGTTVLVVPAVVNQSMDYAGAYRLSQEAMRRAGGLADELAIKIAFENVWNNFLLSPLEAARYCDELNDGRPGRTFGWYFDIGNIVNYAWPEQWIRTLGGRILKLDVKDFSRKKRDENGLWHGFGAEIGEGDAGWERVVDSLREIGYTGWASAEVAGGGPDRLTDIARRMATVFQMQ